jgi:hypothetical protein
LVSRILTQSDMDRASLFAEDVPMDSGSVSVKGDSVRIDHWEFTDKNTSDLLRERPIEQWNDLLGRLIRIGALAIRDAGDVNRIDYARAEFDRFLNELQGLVDREVTQQLQKFFDPERGVFLTTVQGFLGPDGKLTQMFDERRSDSIASSLRTLLEQNLTGQNSVFVKALDPNRVDTPIGQLRAQLAGAVEEAKLAIVSRIAGDEVVEEVSSRTTLKGRKFEDLLFPALKEIANSFGDSIEDVRAANKDGDFVVTVDPKYTGSGNLKFAIEVKDRSVPLPQTQRELENAKRQWAAMAAVMVFAMPEQSPQDAAFRHTGQGYLCVYDKDKPDSTALQVAYQLARLDALRASQTSEQNGLRLTEANTLLDRAASKLRDIATLKASLTGVTKTLSEVYLGLETLQQEVSRSLSEARLCLVGAKELPE